MTIPNNALHNERITGGRQDSVSLRSSSFWKKLMVRTAAVVCGALLVTGGLSAFNVDSKISAASALPRITSSDGRALEGGAVSFTLTLSNSQSPMNGAYYTTNGSATSPNDYTAIPYTSFTIEPGKPLPVSVQTKTDNVTDPNESFIFSVMQPNESVLTYTGFIDDVVPTCPAGQTGTPPNCIIPAPTPPGPTPTPPRPTPPTPTPAPVPVPVPSPGPTPTPPPPVVVTNITPPPTPPPAPGEPERSAFVRSVTDPSQLPRDFGTIAKAFLLAAFLVLLIFFPADLFNGTLQTNYDEVSGWFKLNRVRHLHEKISLHKLPIAFSVAVYAGLAALLNSQLSPDFGFNRASVALLLGMFLALIVTATTYDLVRGHYLKRRYGFRSRLRTHAIGLGTGGILVIISRMANFLPGYLYGLFTGLVYHEDPTDEQDGEGLAVASVALLALAVGGWFALIPVREAVALSGAAFPLLVLEAGLATLWVSTLGAIVFGLIPMRYLYGEPLKKWSTPGWLLIYGSGMTLFVYTLLDPAQSFYGKSDKVSLASVLALFFGFGIFSITFWAYFRYRHLWRHTSDAPTELS